jgi:uncharacterized protein YmfQ (DUF2313 family)
VSHSALLTRLFPLEIGGVFADDIAIEGAYLDAAQLRAEDLLWEIFPDQSRELLPDYERVCSLTPTDDEPLQYRREKVLQKLRDGGSLSRAYFIALAASLGYAATIDEMQPFRAGINHAGDTIWVPEIIFCWDVNVTISSRPVYYFVAGQSAAGEGLSWSPPLTSLEDIFNELKPAHTYIVFNYI